jgi:hypothetical protein
LLDLYGRHGTLIEQPKMLTLRAPRHQSL